MKLSGRVERALRALGAGDGDRLGIACSGGADSIALLHLLVRMPMQFDLAVLHVDHGLRPDSHIDAAFVEEQAAQLGLPCRVIRADVQREPRGSIEASARVARYSALEAAARDLGLPRIATAHTRDDQAETVLLRMMRGGSLSGIAPLRGAIVRPLLDVSRSELRGWLAAQAIGWREDPTNADVRFERNWVRAELLPLLRERREGVAAVLARLADRSREDEGSLDRLAAELFDHMPVDEVGVHLPATELDAVPPALRTRLLRAAFRHMGADPSWDDIETIKTRRRATFGPFIVVRNADGISFIRSPLVVPEVFGLPGEGVVELPSWGMKVRVGRADVAPWTWRSTVPRSGVIVRPRRDGDRVRTRAGTRKVQDVLVDAKIPSPLRDLVPLIAGDSDAVAVVGLTSYPVASATVVDVEPCSTSWSRNVLWTKANA